MIIAVHNGLYHADDCLAVALVEREHGDCDVIRSRNGQRADLVLDVGGKYDPKAGAYDHHQDGVPVYPNGIKMAACGLYLESMKSLTRQEKDYLLEHALYSVQAQDNGQNLKDLGLEHLQNPFSFVVSAALEKLDNGVVDIGSYCPHMPQIIEFNGGESRARVVVYQNAQGQWNAQVVPIQLGSFDSWVSIPESVSELPGFVFRHKAAFLAGFKNHESALEAARRAANS